MRKIILILFSTLLVVGSCSNNKSRNAKIELGEDKQLDCDSINDNSFIDTIPDNLFFKDKIGTWVCYKYIKGDSIYDKDFFNENFAKEFVKYAYFEIYKDSLGEYDEDYILSGVDIFHTPIYAYERSLAYNGSEEEEVFFDFFDKDKRDSSIFVKSYYGYDDYRFRDMDDIQPFYGNDPLNSLYLFHDNSFILYTEGFIFLFKKDNFFEPERNTYGIPGDYRNFFRVQRTYSTTLISEALLQFEKDFPLAGERLKVDNDAKEILATHDWEKAKELEIPFGNNLGVYMVKIKIEDNDIQIEYSNLSSDEYYGVYD